MAAPPATARTAEADHEPRRPAALMGGEEVVAAGADDDGMTGLPVPVGWPGVVVVLLPPELFLTKLAQVMRVLLPP